MNKLKHTLELNGFDIPNGTIPFDMLIEIAEGLKSISGGALRVLMEGHSTKKGKQPDWLQASTAFELTGLKQGSTILEISSPRLSDALSSAQIPLNYGDMELEQVSKGSALDLGLLAFQQAFEGEDTSLLDKALLKDMQQLKRVFRKGNGSVTLYGPQTIKVKLDAKRFSAIKKLDSITPPSMTARITGKLEMMKHSNSSVQLIADGQVIRAYLTEKMSLQEAKEFFGEEVTIDGIAHFDAKRKVSRFEVSKLRLASASDDYFRRLPQPLLKQISWMEEAKNISYLGTKLSKVMGKWPGDESEEELLAMLD